MRTKWGRARALAMALVMTGACGCSVVDDLRTSDFAKQGAGPILESAVEATAEVESTRITGSFWEKGSDYFVDVWVSRTGDCRGTLRSGGNNMDVRRVDGKSWFKGDSGFVNQATRGQQVPQAVLDKLSTRWVLFDKAPAQATIKKLCDLDLLFKGMKTLKVKDSEEAVRGDETDLDGTQAVTLRSTPGGSHTERLWVASEAPHYIVKVSSDEPREQYDLAFSAFNEEFEVERPAAKEIFTP